MVWKIARKLSISISSRLCQTHYRYRSGPWTSIFASSFPRGLLYTSILQDPALQNSKQQLHNISAPQKDFPLIVNAAWYQDPEKKATDAGCIQKKKQQPGPNQDTRVECIPQYQTRNPPRPRGECGAESPRVVNRERNASNQLPCRKLKCIISEQQSVLVRTRTHSIASELEVHKARMRKTRDPSRLLAIGGTEKWRSKEHE